MAIASAEAAQVSVIDSPENAEARGGEAIDRAAVEATARELLGALCTDPSDEGVRETLRRVADAYAELLIAKPFSLTTFPNDERYDELVVVHQADHLCLSLGGVATRGARTRTSPCIVSSATTLARGRSSTPWR
jgi:GTP cyclohydrolase I